MSGGPYGRGKAPMRHCLKLNEWPAQDRELWVLAITPVDLFAEAGGQRAIFRAHSNRKCEQGYGRWLTHLISHGLFDAAVHPADRITRARVKDYVVDMQSLDNRKNTILSCLQELCDTAKVMAPELDWGFISQIASWVRAKREQPRDKRSRLRGADELYGLGSDLITQAPTQSTPRLAAIAFRDGLMIALLSLCPARRGNLMSLTLNDSLTPNGAGWDITIPGAITKNHDDLEFSWPEPLVEALETYLSTHRPLLARLKNRWAAPVGNCLWVSSHGSPMTEMAFYDRITKRTKAAFGKSVNPHLFRDAGVTTIAIHDPVHVRSAAPLLGHRSLATTEKYYQQAQSLEASRAFSETIMNLRNEPMNEP